eukprot:749353-Hanusia_phi.AAC.2
MRWEGFTKRGTDEMTEEGAWKGRGGGDGAGELPQQNLSQVGGTHSEETQTAYDLPAQTEVRDVEMARKLGLRDEIEGQGEAGRERECERKRGLKCALRGEKGVGFIISLCEG